MFSYLENESFVKYVLERGNIPFHVRGNLECRSNFTFDLFDIRISPPTLKLKVLGEDKERKESYKIDVYELREEMVFRGEIDLPEQSKRGIALALGALEKWADLLCVSLGNPRIIIEPQLPVQAVITTRRPLEYSSLEQAYDLVLTYFHLPEGKKERVSRALWWHRKACISAHYSVFDSYTAYWNCLEILCDVGSDKKFKGRARYTIKQQIKDALKDYFGPKRAQQAQQWVFHCFEITPEEDQLYRIRNNINHGNIRENSEQSYERVYLRGLLLAFLVKQLLNQHLGRGFALGDIDELWSAISKPSKLYRNK